MNAIAGAPGVTSERPLAVLAVARCLPFHGIGGMQAIAWDILVGMARRGHRVTVLTTAIAGRASATFEAEGVIVEPLAGTVPGRYSTGWWRATREYAERALAGRVDAVLSISSAAASLLPLKRSLLDVPFVFQVHGSSWAEAVAKWQSARPLDWVKSARNVYWLAKDAGLYRGFDRLVFVGDALRRQFEEAPLKWMTRGVARATIANGIDTGRFRFDPAKRRAVRERLGYGDDDRVLIFAARLNPQKGAAEAIRALAALRRDDPSYELLIIGDGPEAGALRKLADELGCAAAVTFAGAVDRDAMPSLLAAGNVFVFPAAGGREGLPLNVLEALSVGLPCVCASDLRGIFGELEHVAYAPARDSDAFAAAVRRCVLESAPSGTLLPREYSLERCIDAYESVLRGAGGG